MGASWRVECVETDLPEVSGVVGRRAECRGVQNSREFRNTHRALLLRIMRFACDPLVRAPMR